MVSNAPTSLAPGFRFHPTDEELVRYYLRRKIFGKPFRLDAISEIDIYKTEPWDLPSMSKLKTRDLEWYFFSVLDKKYGNGSRTNRATEKGYWKTTGKDRAVLHRSQVVGMKKTLVYHFGRAPKGQRTNWVMHEYRHIDEALNKAGFVQDSVVLCRVFQKSGPGPKNGEQYGAPLIEEEWEDDEFEVFLKAEAMEVGEDAYLDENDIDQILGAEDEPVDVPLLPEHNSGEGALFVGGSMESVDDSQQFMISLEDYTCEEEEQMPNGNSQKLLDSSEGCDYVQDQLEDNTSYVFSDDKKQVKHEYIGEEPNRAAIVLEGVDHKNDEEQYVDASDNFGSDLGTFFERDDLLNPLDVDTSAFDMLDEYLAFSSDIDGMPDYITFDSPLFGGSPDHISREIPPTSQDVIEKSQPVESNEQTLKHHDDASSSKQIPSKYRTDFQQHPFMKQASQMLMGNIHAPPAFASEFPSSFNLKSLSPASSPVHVTAGMIQIRDSSRRGSEMVHEKDGICNITFSFGMSRGDDNSTTLESVVRILPGKAVSMIFGSGSFYLMLLSILVLSMSCKIGSLIFAQ